MKKLLSLLFLYFSSLMPSSLESANFVTLKAWASEEYLKERARDPNKRIQTYQFLEGHHWKGRLADNSVVEFTF
ncbi:MAG: hypothetical protein P8L44_08735 [Opitutales bacterium]|nr:hypothetical protein [Opitutales bacterium]